MIPQEYTNTLFNPISFHDPYFDRVPGVDEFQLSAKDMFAGVDNSNNNSTNTFPSTYPAFRRMSADTQASSNDSSSAAAYSSPDHKPSEKMNMANGPSSSVVLPPIHDLPRPTSPETSDASSTTRSPQWPHQHQQQHQQVAHHHHYSPPHHQSPAYNFPPIDHHSRRPQLHINPPPDHQRVHVASYPTPTTASTMSNQSSYSASSSTSYNPYPNTASVRDHGYRPVGNSVAPPPPPVVTPATLAAAVGTQQRRRGKLPKPVTEFLKKWLLAHTDHPYPTEDEKKWLCSETGLSMSQVSNWMINARRRILAPAAKNAAAAAAAQSAANVAVASSATSAAATPYYTRSPPMRTVSGSSSDGPANGGYTLTHGGYHTRRESGYSPYPSASSRMANGHHHQQQQQQQQQQHQHHQHQPQHHQGHQHYSSSPATPSYSAPPYTGAYHYTTNSGGAPAPPALVAPYASASTLAPFGDSDGNQNGTERTKSPAGDFAYAPQ